MTLFEQKAAARKIATTIRKVAHQALAETAPTLLASQRFPAKPTPSCHIVSGFFPFRSEIDTRALLGRLAGEGWTTCLPIVLGEGLPLEFRRWLPGEPTIKNVMNIDRPDENAAVVEPDVLIVPLLSFDAKGFRLGYGGGFYDRTLAKLRAKKTVIAIGAAYSAQQVESVLHDAHDQPLDYVMTEVELIKCG